ncbi:Aste57867_19774 [Aphanomyces stellatus]|uniref:Aste57867_19774 protein n=1 Tax=Aphanomyces stellatus TaxID=120398 RepID=A0A485LEW0_9STRA|nr:hypothetical protein As57867_019709 [Aphanomyces stellatus]VFT96472.1 Aste57867_19774 [Aphanomyces stellatus]
MDAILWGVVRLHFVTSGIILVTDPCVARYILATNMANFPRDGMLGGFDQEALFGTGLINANGSLHDEQRKRLNPLFLPSRVKTHIGDL